VVPEPLPPNGIRAVSEPWFLVFDPTRTRRMKMVHAHRLMVRAFGLSGLRNGLF